MSAYVTQLSTHFTFWKVGIYYQRSFIRYKMYGLPSSANISVITNLSIITPFLCRGWQIWFTWLTLSLRFLLTFVCVSHYFLLTIMIFIVILVRATGVFYCRGRAMQYNPYWHNNKILKMWKEGTKSTLYNK